MFDVPDSPLVPTSGRGRQPQADMDGPRAIDLLAHLRRREIAVWVDGGWAVDALLGEHTRPHDDLDLVVALDDAARLETALGERGYVLAGGGVPHSFELVDAEGHQVDAHPFARTPSGDGVYRLADGGEWIYPAAGFGGTGRIAGEEVPCFTPEVVLVNHSSGYALDESHRRDVEALAARFGLPVPPFEAV